MRKVSSQLDSLVSVKMWFIVVVSSFLLALATGQDFAAECPAPDGFFADARQCDKYYSCTDNVLTEKLCPDGMAFVDHNSKIEKCDYIPHVDCTGRPDLQPAQPSGNCPRQNGYFRHPDSKVCNEFFFCNAGTGNSLTCPDGLLFSEKTNNCGWPDVAERTGCADEKTTGFQCPKVTADVANAHPRYPDPTDCQFFYVCISGVNPRRNGCTFGQVFNSNVSACTPPQEVPECADYYSEYFEDYFNTLTTSKGLAGGDIIAAAIAAGYDVPNLKDKVRVGNRDSSSLRRRPSAPRTQTSAAAPARAAQRAPARQELAVAAAPQPKPSRTSSRPQPRRPGSSSSRRVVRPLPAAPVLAATQPSPPPPPPTPTPTQPKPALDYADYAYDLAGDTAFYDYPAEAAPAPAPAQTTIPTTPPPPPPTETSAPRRTILQRRPRPQRRRGQTTNQN